jgi:TetR/AcrR family transcriptional repressor of mexJK operon
MNTSTPAAGRRKGRVSKEMASTRDTQVVDIAFDLFVRDGYHAVSLATIAAEARVAVRTIYTRFGGKAGLLREMIDRERLRHQAQLARLPAPAEIGERLDVLARHLLGRGIDEGVRDLQILVIGHEDKNLARACYEAGPGQFLDLLRGELARAQVDGTVGRAVAPADLADLFVGMVRGGGLARYFSDGEAQRHAAPRPIAERVRLFLQAARAT